MKQSTKFFISLIFTIIFAIVLIIYCCKLQLLIALALCLPFGICLTLTIVFGTKKNQQNLPYNTNDIQNILDYCNNFSPDLNGLDFDIYTKNLEGKKIQTNQAIKIGDTDIYSGHPFIEFGASFLQYPYGLRYKDIIEIKISVSPITKNIDFKIDYTDIGCYTDKGKTFTYFRTNTDTISFTNPYFENAKEFCQIVKTVLALSKIKKEQELMQQQLDIKNFTAEFYDALNMLSNFDIKLPEEKNVESHINRVEDMPEITISKITKSFNKQCLTSVVAINIETTGLSANKGDEILELSATKFIDGEATEKFTTYIKPKTVITEKSIEYNGITNEMVTYSPSIDEVRKPFLDFIGNSSIVSYNVFFVMKFLYVYGFEELFKKKRKYFDLFTYIKNLYETNCHFPSIKLKDVCNHFNIFWDDTSALSKSYATGKLFYITIDKITLQN
ncbi:MAG: 3'-5' exonuclease [Bacteroides sp.]|nr:3'-5' exonuclease [Bacillota bacterium]MCM1393599.1 3'-5' exonuclease [[Eubacterium] siraeum]MCM1455811.1 3'-5' exonuclease [Bacteroides sp.]